MKTVKNTIPVYDICSLQGNNQLNTDIIAEPFAAYLAARPNLHLPHRHSFYHMVLFTKGAGFHTIDFERFDVAPGQMYFMKPGQVHSWNFSGQPDGYVLNFSAHLFDNFLVNTHYPDTFRFLRGIAADCVLRPGKEVFAAARAIVEKIVKEVHAPGPYMQDMVRACLIELFIVAARSTPAASQGETRPGNQLILDNFRKLVDAHFAEKRLPRDYAAMLYITPNHLNALCQDLVGMSAGHVIRARILLEAKRLLVNADAGIAGIAGALSFTDSSHFTRFFRSQTGITPEEFRKKSFTK